MPPLNRGSHWPTGPVRRQKATFPGNPEFLYQAQSPDSTVTRSYCHQIPLSKLAMTTIADENGHPASRGTVCWRATRSRWSLNHRVMLELPTVHGNVVRIPAKAKWSADGESGHRVGCEFVSYDGCTTLYAAVGAVDEEEPVCETPPLDTRVWTWLALLFPAALVRCPVGVFADRTFANRSWRAAAVVGGC